jgi:hypothetical protein
MQFALLLGGLLTCSVPPWAGAGPATSRSGFSATAQWACGGDALQQFDVEEPAGTGRVIDGATGRCLTAVASCTVQAAPSPIPGTGWVGVVLEECGSAACGGKSQLWTAVPAKDGPPEIALETEAITAGGVRGGAPRAGGKVFFGTPLSIFLPPSIRF